MECPIPHDCMRELETTQNLARGDAPVPDNIFRGWMSSVWPEVRARAFSIAYEQPHRCSSLTEKEQEHFFLGFIYDSVCDDLSNDYRYDAFDALWALRGWIEQTDAQQRDGRDTLSSIKKMLEKICANCDDRIRTLVVDVVLEHVFVDPSVHELFSDWKNVSQLSGLFAVATQEAALWKTCSVRRNKPNN